MLEKVFCQLQLRALSTLVLTLFCWRVHRFDSVKPVSSCMQSQAPVLRACFEFLLAIVLNTRFQCVSRGFWFCSHFPRRCVERYPQFCVAGLPEKVPGQFSELRSLTLYWVFSLWFSLALEAFRACCVFSGGHPKRLPTLGLSMRVVRVVVSL